MKHFRFFPQIEYSQNTSVNLLVRSKIKNLVLQENTLYYDYVVREGERPDVIAKKYYGNSDYTWVLFYANNIKNPLTDWPLDSNSFSRFIINKYGSLEYAQSTIQHYLLNEKYIIDEKTFVMNSDESDIKRAVTIYEYEESLNEKKRNIKILDARYLNQIKNEIRNIFK